MAGFVLERARTLALLKALPAGAGLRSGHHEELGLITVAQLVNEYAFHDLGHIPADHGTSPGSRILSGDGRLSGLLQGQPVSLEICGESHEARRS